MLFKWEVFGVEISPGTTGTSRDLARVPGDVGDDMSSPMSLGMTLGRSGRLGKTLGTTGTSGRT